MGTKAILSIAMNPDIAPTLNLLRERIRTATTHRTPLCLRGGGSKDFYGQSLQGEVLDTTVLQGIVSYEPSELVVTVRSGTPLAELEALLAASGQYLPFEPPHYARAQGQATVGGMVASGLNGPARANAGSVRDHVLGVTLLNGRGELLRFGGEVIKNVAGYDVSRVMVGAMGTLGLLVEVSLKVLPLPPAEATLRFNMTQAEALAQLHRWGGQPLPLNASCWLKDTAIHGHDYGLNDGQTQGQGTLYLRLRGAVAAVEAACKQLLSDALPTAQAMRLDNTQAATDWHACRNHQLPFFTTPPSPDMALWRLSVAQTSPALDVPWPQLVEWHGALRWLWAPLTAASTLREAAVTARGNATVFVAPKEDAADVKGEFNVFTPLPAPLDRIHRQLKAEFDPAGIFNRGRLYDSF